jgi:hypothetical protein
MVLIDVIMHHHHDIVKRNRKPVELRTPAVAQVAPALSVPLGHQPIVAIDLAS